MLDLPRQGGGRLSLDRERILEILESRNLPVEDYHVLLPYRNFVGFICEGMACIGLVGLQSLLYL